MEYLPPDGRLADEHAGSSADDSGVRCARCRCLPQEHVACKEEGYDPASQVHVAARRKYDPQLLPAEERAALFKARGDAAFKEKNFRTAYLEYTRAMEATPDNHVILANRCQAYLKVGKTDLALADAERAVALAPEWVKGHYRLGSCLQQLDRHEEAVAAFESACALEGATKETTRALEEARRKRADWEKAQGDLDFARKRTTIRQASDQYEEERFAAKLAAKRDGRIAEIGQWDEKMQEHFEKEYFDNIKPPAGVEFALTYNPDAGGGGDARAAGGADDGEGGDEGGDDDGGGILLEENVDAIGGGGDKGRESPSTVSEYDVESDEEAAAERNRRDLLDDSRWVPKAAGGADGQPSTALTLPPRNYTLVHEDGRLHKKDNFEPISFGMQRIHKESEPEPVWVQTKTARWHQSAEFLSIIPHTVPPELCKSSEVKVSFARRQVHVQAVRSKVIYMAGELEAPIDPVQSTWTTDGTYILITAVKENLVLYNGARGDKGNTHWFRLFTSDQYLERGMIDADYSDLPYEIRRDNKISELRTKEKEKKEEDANKCAVCGKDVRFFCDCRDGDQDFERPLPDGWKKSKLGFTDNYGDAKLTAAHANELKVRPPSPPRPYQGRPTPKYGVDGRGRGGGVGASAATTQARCGAPQHGGGASRSGGARVNVHELD